MATFFTNPTDTLSHSGSSIGSIKKGDSQTSINESLAREVEELKNKIAQLTNAAPVSTTDAIENKSGFGITDTFTSTEYKAKIITKPTASGIDVSYDISEALGKDTKIYSKVSVEGLKNGFPSIIVDSDKLSSGFSLSPDSFPAYLTVDLRKKTDSGDVFLSAKVPLNPTGDNLSTTLYARKFGGTELNTQTKVNDFLFNRLKDVEGNLNKDVNINNENKSIQDAINQLYKEVQDLKNQDLSSAKVQINGTTKSLSDLLSESTGSSSSRTTSSGSIASSSSSSSSSSSNSNSTSTNFGGSSNDSGSSDIKDSSSNIPTKDNTIGSVLDTSSGITIIR